MRVAEALDRLDGVLGGVYFGPLASAPEHVRARAQLDAEVHRPHRLLERVRADARVVRRERAVLEDRIGEQVRRRHRHGHAVRVERALEVADDAVALGRRRVDRDEVVVVEVHAPGAQLAEPLNRCHRVERRPDELAERIAAAVADGPEPEGEFVGRGRLKAGHVGLLGSGPRPSACASQAA